MLHKITLRKKRGKGGADMYVFCYFVTPSDRKVVDAYLPSLQKWLIICGRVKEPLNAKCLLPEYSSINHAVFFMSDGAAGNFSHRTLCASTCQSCRTMNERCLLKQVLSPIIHPCILFTSIPLLQDPIESCSVQGNTLDWLQVYQSVDCRATLSFSSPAIIYIWI